MNCRLDSTVDTINIASPFPGTGKGTLAGQLISHFSAHGHTVDYVEVGDIVRTGIGQDARFRQSVESYDIKGQKVPDEIIVPKIRERIQIVGAGKLLFLDGFPRKETQIDPYIETLQQLGRNDVFVYLNVPKEVAEARMVKRAQLAEAKGEKPRPQDLNAKLRKTRLDLDEADMGPVIHSARSRGKLIEIDASRSQDEVRQAVLEALEGIMLIHPVLERTKMIA
jgi:adenylate kinase family enzyme